jgi:hypothetical protein
VADERRAGYSGSTVESRRWTDERIDDLAETMRGGFERMDREFGRVHEDIRELRQWIFRLTLGISAGFVSVVAAILARGG